MKIEIAKNTNGDSRTANHIPTFEEFEKANLDHRMDVARVMSEMSTDIRRRGFKHDITKTDCGSGLDKLFYHDLCETLKGNMKFEDGEWSAIHYNEERHHLNSVVPEDVNLIDVMEMIADCVCAGMARSGSVRPIKIRNVILQKAVTNTVKMIEDYIIVKEEE